MTYEKLFERGRIGKVNLKNRVVMTAMGVNLANAQGEANDVITRYYEERAKGGVGLIITEVARIDDEYGVGTPNQLSVTEGRHIPHLERMIETIQKYGTKVFVQLHHPGRETKSHLIGGKQIVAPSAIMCQVTQEMPRALSTEECEGLVKKFIKGAVIAKTCGADGVELHVAHGYLLNQFVSPYSNKRTDKYGGSFQNRLRMVSEIITGIKYMCGADFPISVRISADEFVEGGLKIDESIKIARTLESYGIDAINVSSGTYESATTIIESGSYPQGWKKHLADAVRKNVKIPVIAVNNIKDPETAEQLLQDGVCDFVGVARGTLADPYWVKKAKEGKSDQIRKCIGCLNCFAELTQGRHIKCTVNATLGREIEFSDLQINGAGNTVAVIGGGPAGMQAALVLDQRGYKTILFDDRDKLGGTLNVADKAPIKDKVLAMNNGLVREIEASGVEVKAKTKATVEMIKKLNPSGVFVAVGAVPTVPPILGIDSKNVMKAEDVLLGKATPIGKVAVIGSGLTGLETAELLADKGHPIILVEMQKNIGPGINRTILADLMMRFKKHEPLIMSNHRLMSIGDKGIVLMNQMTSQPIQVEADTIVLALGVTPRSAMVHEFMDAFDNVRVIGDAEKAGRIQEAIKEGYSQAFAFTTSAY
ncbi:FAD-dependent oxidoreductase [uncultured Acetobacterium sp.]|uniref:oxidoreductase n=1 Tax=uncultured Acetobacterium sp. TaxID=217139 RepID=UPI0025F7D690|nr:FAD-dependent oxidoreductase [uncultured Acetobacterium sp.]